MYQKREEELRGLSKTLSPQPPRSDPYVSLKGSGGGDGKNGHTLETLVSGHCVSCWEHKYRNHANSGARKTPFFRRLTGEADA